MKVKVRLIYTFAEQDGEEHWSQRFATVDTEIDVPQDIKGKPLIEWSYVGLEFDPEKNK